jgi:hypothetical protein
MSIATQITVCWKTGQTQRLLNRACWDMFTTMGVVRRFAVAGPDETAFMVPYSP